MSLYIPNHWFIQMDNQVVVSDYSQMDRVLKEERQYILNIVKQIKKIGCNVLLIQKSILRLLTRFFYTLLIDGDESIVDYYTLYTFNFHILMVNKLKTFIKTFLFI